MSEQKHTPGPWVVDPDHPRDISPADDLRLGVASICNADNINGGWVFGEESKANASLVAAAPDLLQWLLALECDINTMAYCYDKKPENFWRAMAVAKENAIHARAAIAKARGQS